MNELKWHRITSWEEALSDRTMDMWLDYYNRTVNASVFHHPSMGLAWIESYRRLRDISPMFYWLETPEMSFFYPLVIWRRNWKNVFQRLIVPVGFSDFDYLDPILFGEMSLQKRESLLNLFVKDVLNNSDADEMILCGIRDGSRFQLKSERHRSDVCPWLDLSKFPDFQAFQSSLRTSLRGDLSRQQRHLAERGDVSLKVYSLSEKEEILEQLPLLLAYHQARYPKSYQAPGFHIALVRRALESGLLHFSALMVGKQPVSWHLGFCERKVFYYYLPATHPDFLRFSPGKVHLLLLNKWALEHQIEVFDHLRGEENYKNGWTDSVQNIYQLQISNSSIISRIRNYCVDLKSKL